jgi:hypothetical protein|tara:strand:+ start:205 stop:633 length:429 start_codon:yes stop_codon:yes gene_type:complete
MINKDKIFQLFVDGKKINEDQTKAEIKDFMDGPYAKIGMFVKLIQNHQVFHQKLEKFLKRESPDYDVESTKEASEYTVYNRAWSYIKQVDLEKPGHIDAILNFDPKVLFDVLDTTVKYFEASEDYTKCAHLFSIQQIAKEIA